MLPLADDWVIILTPVAFNALSISRCYCRDPFVGWLWEIYQNNTVPVTLFEWMVLNSGIIILFSCYVFASVSPLYVLIVVLCSCPKMKIRWFIGPYAYSSTSYSLFGLFASSNTCVGMNFVSVVCIEGTCWFIIESRNEGFTFFYLDTGSCLHHDSKQPDRISWLIRYGHGITNTRHRG